MNAASVIIEPAPITSAAGRDQASRLREMVLGGVTRHMMKHMTVPVLMSS